MAWKGLHLSRPSRLSTADGQIVVAQDDGEARVALEDVAYVILDTPQATLTTTLLSACMEAGVAIVVSDARHMPSGLLLPFHTHHRQAGSQPCKPAPASLFASDAGRISSSPRSTIKPRIWNVGNARTHRRCGR